jgi:hypothetical protein
MKLSTLFIIAAVISFLYGLAFMIVPANTMALYGVSLSVGGLFIVRYLGATFIGLAVLAWLARNARPSEARAAIVLALFTTTALGFVVALYDKFAGVGNALVWSSVVIYLLLAIGFGYFSFMRGGDA